MSTREQELLRRMQEADEITPGDAVRAQALSINTNVAQPDGDLFPEQSRILDLARGPSPAGINPEQAGVLRKLREGGDRFTPDAELSTFDRVAGRFARGVQQEQTLGREGVFGEQAITDEVDRILNKEGFDVSDVAEVAGRILGAAPLALATGGAATLGARTLASRLAARAPGIAKALTIVGGSAEKAASLGGRILQGAAQNVFEGLAYSAVAGPARVLEEDQSRARAVAQEFGIGAAADFIFGAALGTGGTAARQVARAFSRSDNSIDREIGTALIRLVDDIDAQVGGPGAAPGQTTPASVSRETLVNPAELSAPDAQLPPAAALEQIAPPTRAPSEPIQLGPPRQAEIQGLGASRDVQAEALGVTDADLAVNPTRDPLGDAPQKVAIAEGITDGTPAEVELFHSREFGREFDPDQPIFFGTRATRVIEEQGGAAPRKFTARIENPTVIEADNFGNIAEGGASERAARARLIQVARDAGNDAVVIKRSNAVGEGDEVILVQPRGRVTDAEGRLVGEGAEAGDALPIIEGTQPRPQDLAAPAEATPVARPAPTPEDLAIPRVASPEGQQAVQGIAGARTASDVFEASTRAQDAPLSAREASTVQEFTKGRLESIEAKGKQERRRTARRLAGERKGRKAAQKDELTGVVSQDASRRALSRVDADPDQQVLGFDLTNFKAINDNLGTGRGDERLQEVAGALRQAAGEFGINERQLLRPGGDEFAVPLPANMPPARVEAFGARVAELVPDLQVGEFTSSVRFAPGATFEASMTAATALKATETGPRARDVRVARPPGTPDNIPAPDAKVPKVVRKLGFEGNPQPLNVAVDQLGEGRIKRLDQLAEIASKANEEIVQVRNRKGQLKEVDIRRPGRTPGEQIALRDNALHEIEDQYGSEVADQVRVRLGLNPLDRETTLFGQATSMRHADAAATAFTKGANLKGKKGGDVAISTPSGRLSAEYRVVPIESVHASHTGSSFQPDPDYYPVNSVQQRDYLNNTANRDAVVEIATKPDMDAFLDRLTFAQTGPPVMSPDGKAIAGNGRTMALKRMQELNPKGFADYQAALKERAAEFGLRGEIPEGSILVRTLTDESVDFSDVNQLRELNIEFDKSVGKAKSAVEDAASRADVLKRSGSKALTQLETIEPDQTLRAFLWTAEGKTFVKELRSAGVITTEEAGQLLDGKTGFLTERGREVVTETLMVSAIGDAPVVRRTPSVIKDRVEHSIPGLIRAQGTDWDLQPVIREALEIHANLSENPQFTGRTGKVNDFRGQQDLFTEGAPSPRALDVAEVLEESGKRDVTEAFRAYFREMDIALRQGQSGDLFGFEPKKPEAAFQDSFGALKRIADSKRTKCR